MDESLEGFLKTWGNPTRHIEADEAVLAALAHRVPPILIEYWRHLGFSVFKNGLMTLCNPLEWKPLIDEWINGTELEQLDIFIPVMKGVRGEFHLFGINHGFKPGLSPIDGRYVGSREIPQVHFDVSIKQLLMTRPEAFVPTAGREDFLKAFREHAPFAANEMLGYVPSLPMGGTRDYANLLKVGAFSYLFRLRQVTGKLEGDMK